MGSKDVKLSSDVDVTSSSPDDSRLRKSWGHIVAYPHEYLIHFRRGQLSEKTSGQGARCFKWPQDTVFIIPTSLKEIIFEANQLSADNVDVRIRGMAVYRIGNPRQIYTLLNFSNRQQAEEKLARMIGDLCRSTAKWLVANMGVEECLRKRKEDIAEALKQEVAHVVADDQRGWGVEVITVDIQDVYIQDPEIFAAMQVLFKTEKLRESQLSTLELEKDLQIRRFQQDRELSEHRKTKELESARIEAEITNEKITLSRQNDEKQFVLDRYRVEQNEGIIRFKLDQENERQRQKILLRTAERQAELEAQRLAHQIEIDAQRQRMEVENSATPLSLEKNFIEGALPVIAEAMAKNLNNSRINIIQGDGSAGTQFSYMLAEIMSLLRARIERVEKPGEGDSPDRPERSRYDPSR